MTGPPRVVASGLRFPEGPTALGGGAFAVVEMQGEGVARVASDGTVSPLADLGGGPNGSALGSDGAVYVANNGGLSAAGMEYWHAPREFDGIVQRIGADGAVATVNGDLPGTAPHRPNDLCFAPDGSLLVTDSANWEDMRNLNPGHVVRIAPDGTTSSILELPALPNGIGFGPDGRLYVAQSLTRKILAFEWADGAPGDPVTFCKLGQGMPDGFCFAADGRLFVCGSIGNVVEVFTADGEPSETIETGEASQPTNCCLFEGSLYVTLANPGELVAYEVGADPLPLHQGSITPPAATG